MAFIEMCNVNFVKLILKVISSLHERQEGTGKILFLANIIGENIYVGYVLLGKNMLYFRFST
jgi:hypothetical protein